MVINLWRRLANIDLRTLALFRIALASSLIIALMTYAPDFSYIFPDDGIFPRSNIIENFPDKGFSLFLASAYPPYTIALFAIGYLSALALLVGYYTRTATIIAWVIVASLNSRLEPFLYYADTQLLMLLFWSIFLPLGARFSVDHALSRPRLEVPNNFASLATLAILLQESYLYIFGALFKDSDIWRVDHTAIQYAFNMLEVKRVISEFLLQYPVMLQYLTAYVFYLELLCVIFLFLPVMTEWSRLIFFFLLAAMHVGFGTLLNVGYFPIISITGLMVFLPGFIWDYATRIIATHFRPSQHTIYYDQPCDFCCKTCLIFRELSILQSAHVEPAQDTPAIYEVMQRENSWVVKTDSGALLTKWEAVSYMWRHSPILFIPGILFSLPGMKQLGEAIYHCIAKNRGKIAKYSARFLPYRSMDIKPSLLSAFVLVPLIALVFTENWYETEEGGYENMPLPLRKTVDNLHLYQEWKMFAPWPRTTSNWFHLDGQMDDGKSIELYFNKETSSKISIPTIAMETAPSDRMNCFLGVVNDAVFRNLYAPGYCAVYNQTHDRKIVTLTGTEYMRPTRIDRPRSEWPLKKRTLFVYDCDTKTKEDVDTDYHLIKPEDVSPMSDPLPALEEMKKPD